MSESDDKTEDVLKDLTPDEQRVLAQAIKQVERTLLERTIKKIRNWIIIATGVLTICGVISFISIKTTIIDQAAKRLSGDSELRNQVVEQSIEKLETATNVLDKVRKKAIDLDVESGRIATIISSQLEEIHAMIDQVRTDLQQLADSQRKDNIE